VLNANTETGPERHRSVMHEILLEAWKQLAEGALAAEQLRVHVPGLRRPRAIRWLRGQSVALQNNYLIEAAGKRPRGRDRDAGALGAGVAVVCGLPAAVVA